MKKWLLTLVVIIGLLGNDTSCGYFENKYKLSAIGALTLGSGLYGLRWRWAVQDKFAKDQIKQEALQNLYTGYLLLDFAKEVVENQVPLFNFAYIPLNNALSPENIFSKNDFLAEAFRKFALYQITQSYRFDSIPYLLFLINSFKEGFENYLSPPMRVRAYLNATINLLNLSANGRPLLSIYQKAKATEKARKKIKELKLTSWDILGRREAKRRELKGLLTKERDNFVNPNGPNDAIRIMEEIRDRWTQ